MFLSYGFQLPSQMTLPERLQFRKFLEEWNPKLTEIKHISVVVKPGGRNRKKRLDMITLAKESVALAIQIPDQSTIDNHTISVSTQY